MGNIYFKHRSLQKYTKVAGCQAGVQVKSMIDLMLVKMDILRYVQYVRSVGGMKRGISDHYIVLCYVGLVGTWIKNREVVGETEVYHFSLAFQCTYGCSDDGDGIEGSDIHGGEKRVEITWPLVCKCSFSAW